DAAGKDVFADPRIGRRAAFVAADAVHERQPAGLQTRPDQLEEAVIVRRTDVFEQADADHAVEILRAGHRFAVVLQADIDRQTLADTARVVDLLAADVVADHLAAVLGGQVAGQLAEAATELENAHARLQMELAGHQRELGPLRLVQGFDFSFRAVIRTGVLHGRAQHGLVEPVGQVVVPYGPLARAATVLRIAQAAEQHLKERRRTANLPIEPGALNVGEELVELVGVPPAVHVGLAGAERAFGQNALVQTIVVHLNVPGSIAADLHVGGF